MADTGWDPAVFQQMLICDPERVPSAEWVSVLLDNCQELTEALDVYEKELAGKPCILGVEPDCVESLRSLKTDGNLACDCVLELACPTYRRLTRARCRLEDQVDPMAWPWEKLRSLGAVTRYWRNPISLAMAEETPLGQFWTTRLGRDNKDSMWQDHRHIEAIIRGHGIFHISGWNERGDDIQTAMVDLWQVLADVHFTFSKWASRHKQHTAVAPEGSRPPVGVITRSSSRTNCLFFVSRGSFPRLRQLYSLLVRAVEALEGIHAELQNMGLTVQDLREISSRSIGSDIDSEAAAVCPTPKTKRKKSTEKGEGEAKLLAALTIHHKYADGSCLNLEPAGNNELAQCAKVSKSTASAFFNKQFGGHTKYRAICSDRQRLITALKLLNREFAPDRLFGAKPPGEGEREDEE